MVEGLEGLIQEDLQLCVLGLEFGDLCFEFYPAVEAFSYGEHAADDGHCREKDSGALPPI